jgi:hypothetical protein
VNAAVPLAAVSRLLLIPTAGISVIGLASEGLFPMIVGPKSTDPQQRSAR